MLKAALFLATGAAVLAASPADAQYRYHHYYHHHHRHYYSYYSPYSYAYPAYSYPAYSYPVYYGYPAYYSYPAYGYPTFGISIGLGGYHHRHW